MGQKEYYLSDVILWVVGVGAVVVPFSLFLIVVFLNWITRGLIPMPDEVVYLAMLSVLVIGCFYMPGILWIACIAKCSEEDFEPFNTKSNILGTLLFAAIFIPILMLLLDEMGWSSAPVATIFGFLVLAILCVAAATLKSLFRAILKR